MEDVMINKKKSVKVDETQSDHFKTSLDKVMKSEDFPVQFTYEKSDQSLKIKASVSYEAESEYALPNEMVFESKEMQGLLVHQKQQLALLLWSHFFYSIRNLLIKEFFVLSRSDQKSAEKILSTLIDRLSWSQWSDEKIEKEKESMKIELTNDRKRSSRQIDIRDIEKYREEYKELCASGSGGGGNMRGFITFDTLIDFIKDIERREGLR